jgi:hypothetical protein
LIALRISTSVEGLSTERTGRTSLAAEVCRGYQNLRYLLLKAKRMVVANVEFIPVRSMRKVA